MRRFVWLAAVVMIVVAPVAAQDVDLDGCDPLVADVVRMLTAGVSVDSVSSWLEHSGRRPAALSPDDLIALERAGAPDAMVQHLLALAPAAPEPAAPEPPPASRVRPERALPHRATVTFVVDYRPEAEERTAGWPLFVYLDGRLLAWSEGTAHVLVPGGEEIEVALEPGRHVVRLLQEQHTYQTIGRSWKHRARVLPEPLVLEVGAGEDWTVEIDHLEQRMPFAGGGPGVVSWVVRRDGEVVEDRRGVGPAPHAWPSLCDEVRTALPEEKWDSKRGRRALEGCLSWDELFPAVAGVPSRDEVRSMLEEHRFRPVRVD